MSGSRLARFFVVISLMLLISENGTCQEVPKTSKKSERLLVVAPKKFHPSLEPFIEFKNTVRPTELVDLEQILEKGVGVDDPEKLKRWLFTAFMQRGFGYVLLVGDVSVLPVRYMVLDRVTPAAFDYAFYPSDLYYSDLLKEDRTFEDWNAAKEGFHAGYFGEVRGEKNKSEAINFDQVDYLPEIAVGRWPVETPEEVTVVVNKTITFEKRVLADVSVKRAGFIAVGGWVDTRSLMNKWADTLEARWAIDRHYYSGRPFTTTTPPSPEATRGLFDRGSSLIVHAGHGQADAWEQCFSVSDLDQITNLEHLPVVVSAGCSTAYFAPLAPYGAYLDVNGVEHIGTDAGEQFNGPPPAPSPIQTGRFNPTGLGEQILKRNEHGAVAYIGCNTGSQPCGLTLVEGFLKSISQSPGQHLGDSWNDAIAYYHQKEKLAELKPDDGWYPPSIFFQGMKFMLFGDPSLPLP